jgi:hypothetical protein
MKDPTGTAEYHRDALGRVADIVWRHGPPQWIHFDHDPWGRIAAVSIYSLDAAAKNVSAGPGLAVLDRPLPTSAADWEERHRAAANVAASLASVKPEYRVLYQHDIQGRIVAMDTAPGRSVYRWSREGRQVERCVALFLPRAAAQTSGEATASVAPWRVRLLAPLTTKFNRKGDMVSARVVEPTAYQGSVLEGVVREIKAGSAAGKGFHHSVRVPHSARAR